MTFWFDIGVGAAAIAVAVVLLLPQPPARARVRRLRSRVRVAGSLGCLGVTALTAAAGWFPLTILFAVASAGLAVAALLSSAPGDVSGSA